MHTLPRTIGILLLVLFGTLASGAAMAQHRGHGGGHGYGGGARFGLYLGVPMYGLPYYPSYYAPYYPAPYYYPPAVVVPSSPPVYIEQGAAQAAPAPAQAQSDWFYCAASNAYYPHVGECPAGWQRVPAQPSSH